MAPAVIGDCVGPSPTLRRADPHAFRGRGPAHGSHGGYRKFQRRQHDQCGSGGSGHRWALRGRAWVTWCRSAAGGDRGSRNRPSSPQRARSLSLSPPRGVDATWPTRAFSVAAVALSGSARVREMRHCAPQGKALAAVASAWVFQVTSVRRAVERADGRGVKSALSITGQAVARSVDGDENYELFAQHVEAFQPEAEAVPTRFNSQSILGRRAHADGGTSWASPTVRNTRARSVSQEFGTGDGSRRDEEEEG